MSLPEEQAAQLLSKLTPKQVELVSIEIAKLGRLGGEEQETVIHEFAEANPNSLGLAGGGLDLAKSLVEKAWAKTPRKRSTSCSSRSPPSPSAF